MTLHLMLWDQVSGTPVCLQFVYFWWSGHLIKRGDFLGIRKTERGPYENFVRLSMYEGHMEIVEYT